MMQIFLRNGETLYDQNTRQQKERKNFFILASTCLQLKLQLVNMYILQTTLKLGTYTYSKK